MLSLKSTALISAYSKITSHRSPLNANATCTNPTFRRKVHYRLGFALQYPTGTATRRSVSLLLTPQNSLSLSPALPIHPASKPAGSVSSCPFDVHAPVLHWWPCSRFAPVSSHQLSFIIHVTGVQALGLSCSTFLISSGVSPVISSVSGCQLVAILGIVIWRPTPCPTLAAVN